MDDRDRTIADMNEDLERLRRRIAELESVAAPGMYDERYRLLFESNPLPLWVYDLKTLSFLAVNNAAVRNYGYSREEFLGMTIADIRPSEDIPRLRENIASVTCGLDEAGVWRHRKKDGTIIDVEIVSHTLIFKGREAELVLANDITGRRQAEEALRQQANELAKLNTLGQAVSVSLSLEETTKAGLTVLLEAIQSDLVFLFLREGERMVLQEALPSAARALLGASHKHRVGQCICGLAVCEKKPLYSRDIHQDVRCTWEECKKAGIRSFAALPLLSGDEVSGVIGLASYTDRDFERQASFLETLASQVAIAFVNARLYEAAQREISERKLAQEALRESEERLRLALSAAKQGLYDLNVQTGEAIVSPEYAQMLGYASEEFIETNAKWIERLHPDDQAPVAETYRAYIKGALPEYRVEFRQRTKSGEWKWILSIGMIVEYDDSGNPFRMLGTHTDITDRKKAEQERLEMERRLLHAQKLESLGVLAGGIAHDFNNLLMAILGNLDMALIKLPPDSPAVMNIEQSAQAARRASDLTRQMLAYSGKGSFIVKPMDLEELVTENAHLFRSSVARTTELNVSFDRSLPAINADAGQIQQVIMNLITNASEAIGEKTGVITLATGVQDCDSQCLKQSRAEDVADAGRFVFLEVSDNGCGMDEQTQQRLFDPFFTTKPKGRGLGMSAILGIVRGHRGALFVESTEGRGTAIRVLFPALQRPMPVNDGPSGAVSHGAAATEINGTVLVADDEEMVRNVCKQMVGALGLQVLTAVDGRDAVEVFTKHVNDIALVILDLSMPNMDGLTAFKELARIKPGVKVILCSGFDEQDSLQRFSGKGLAGFIQKPYSIDNLRAAMENAVRGGG